MAADTSVAPWRVEAGERETLTFPVLDTSGEQFGIDGWDIVATIKTRPGGALLYTWPAEFVTFDSDENTIQLVIPAPVSALWTWTTGFYTVTISNPDTEPADPATFRILEGVVVIDPA